MELRICPGLNKPFRLALVDGDAWTDLSEHNTPEQAIAARREFERVCNDAAEQLQRIAA